MQRQQWFRRVLAARYESVCPSVSAAIPLSAFTTGSDLLLNGPFVASNNLSFWCSACILFKHADMTLYGELLKLANGQHVDLFYARGFS